MVQGEASTLQLSVQTLEYVMRFIETLRNIILNDQEFTLQFTKGLGNLMKMTADKASKYYDADIKAF